MYAAERICKVSGGFRSDIRNSKRVNERVKLGVFAFFKLLKQTARALFAKAFKLYQLFVSK